MHVHASVNEQGHADRIATGPKRLAAFIRTRAADILAAWERAVRELPVARDLARPALVDHIPALISQIAELSDDLAAGTPLQLPAALADAHAVDRLGEGYDLDQVVAEYAVLRDAIVRLWSAESAIEQPDSHAIRVLNQAIDGAVAASVQRFTRQRDRALQSLDRIAAAVLETRSLDELLDRLLRVMLETTAAADTAAILLRDGELLRVRAAVGLEDDLATGSSLRIGEGFAGRIAETGEPRSTDAMYGMPLVEDGAVIGVAYMGSRTASTFSQQDQRMFAAMTHRATSAIATHVLREAAERRARQQQAVAELGLRALSESEQLDELFAVAVAAMTDLLGIGFGSVFVLEPGGKLVLRAEAGWGPEHVGTLRMGADEQSAAGLAIRTRGPAIIEDFEREPSLSIPDILRARGIRSGIAVPIQPPSAHGALYGVLGAHSPRPRAFRAEDVVFLQAIAHILGSAIAIHRADADEVARRTELEAVIESIPDAVFIGDGRGIARANTAALDITERRRVLEEQRRARAEAERALAVLDTILAASAVGIAFIDDDLRYVRINDTLAALNDRPAAAHVGHTVREMIGDAAADQLEPLLRQVLETRAPAEGLELTLPSPVDPAETLSFLANFVPVVTAHGDLLGLGAVVIEITSRKRAEEEAQRQARMREEVLAVVSHDLKSPLGAVLLAATMLLPDATGKARRYVETIQRNATRMENLISDLLDMATVQAGRLAVDRRPELAAGIVQESLEAHEPLARAKEVALTTVGDLGDAMVYADRDRILQVLGNLLGNAIKFCRAGDTITLRCVRYADHVELGVGDTGPGISEAELPHIFEPFWSAEKYVKKGTGLGLYIIKGIVETHGGTIRVESKVGDGTTVCFTLPLAGPSHTVPPEVTPTGHDPGNQAKS